MARREQGRGESKGLPSLLDAAAKCSNLVVFSGSGLSATSGSVPCRCCTSLTVWVCVAESASALTQPAYCSCAAGLCSSAVP